MSKLPDVGTTIFTVMSQLANETGAINLSQGFPNFPIDPKLEEILAETAHSDVHQYRPMGGDPVLLEKISRLIQQQYRQTLPTDEILVTAGATQGIFTILQALIYAGDEVVVLDPSYDCYDPSVRLAGGKATHVPLRPDGLPDWPTIRRSISDQTRMLIINNPHNPTGRVWSAEDMNKLVQLMSDFPQLLLLSDEVYEFITFSEEFASARSLDGIQDRIIIVSSFGKTFHITGWKMGYLTAPIHLMEEIKKVHQFNVFCVNSVAQATLSSYLDHVDVSTLADFYRQKRDTFRRLLETSRFELLPCEGTYFQSVSYATISTLPATEFCVELTREHGVAAIPISVFNQDGNDNKLIRFCFAKDDETLIQATEKLCKI